MLAVHHAARAIRGAEYLSLRSQMIRAAASIPTNIVEGRACRSEREFRRFLDIAIASTRELEYQIELARDLGAMDDRTFESLSAQCTDVRKMLYGLVAKLADRPEPPAGERNKQSGRR